ncbi:MAG: hypothetical protein ACTSSE_14710 [Candidatus Thorarchaeota archaeon]
MDEVVEGESRSDWFSVIIFCTMGLTTQIHGFVSVDRFGVGSFLWWYGGYASPIPIIAALVYFELAPAIFFLLTLYLIKLGGREDGGTFAIIASLSSFFTACLWASFWFLFRAASDIYELAYSLIVWGGAIVLFGITFSLLGLIYIRRDSKILTRITGLSFIVVGLMGLVVGYIGGFTLLPWFTIYDFPWVTTAAILPCCLGLVQSLKVE